MNTITLTSVHKKNVLISPLNWGFGHVSRCIGLIDRLINQENIIYLACDVDQKRIFQEYFHGDRVIYLPHEGYPFHFSGTGKFDLDLLKSMRSLNRRLKEELNQTDLFAKEHKIDLIISDHRYGFRSNTVPSVFMTHQLNLPLKWYQRPVQRRHRSLIGQFNVVWVPDYSDRRLSGELSKIGKYKNVEFIGPLSRFERYLSKMRNEKDKKVLVASGPAIYAQQFIDEHQAKDMTIIADAGLSIRSDARLVNKSWLEQDQEIISASELISRSGYSTIMDLDFLKISSHLYFTPGQAEQEYLWKLHHS